ncbi:MAG: dual specificity protein phosphatase [Propionicimonas sp.]|uniref:dual specificity protein phosphatase family protein n=1 Tax=Propionicimonas sp. TaxID=1955623 RepID=UPI002B206428|nr:dual specificity protein phosphatase [Propionicimonas sp.]MEA4944557.1 dual specificity protein phosphatase [Propionicimonas sp.]MEA5054081.1 dual specificity protein phosphatase [Propionicimonas sp.]MEA5118589.1 dual specificity protein phosphatase [Propionicimonas sp.]
MSTQLPVLEVANAQFVTDRLAVGGDLAPEFSLARRQLQELVAAGITHIADLRDEWSDEALVAVWAPQIRYLNHGVEDAGQTIPPDWFEELNSWVSDALADPDAKVLVHCHMGVNRGPSALLAVMLAQGWKLRDALTAIRTARPIAVIDYADDALAWHLDRAGASAQARAGATRSLKSWREANHLDLHQVIRQIRQAEGSGSIWAVALDPQTALALAEVIANHPRPTVGLGMDHEPDELAIRDELVLVDPDGSVLGFGMVAGPPQPVPDGGALALPVLVLEFDVDPLLTADMMKVISPEGLGLGGPNPARLTESAVRTLNLALRLLASALESD